MKEIRIKFTDETYDALDALAKEKGFSSVNSYVRSLLPVTPGKLDAREAVDRALKLPDGVTFAMRDLFTVEEWKAIGSSPGEAGALGRAFFQQTQRYSEIVFLGGGSKGRRARYQIKRNKEEIK